MALTEREQREYRAQTITWVINGLYCRTTDQAHLTLLKISDDKTTATLSDGSNTPTWQLDVIGPKHNHNAGVG